MQKAQTIRETSVRKYPNTGNRFSLISRAQRGIDYKEFKRIVELTPFSLNEWSGFLNLTQRTIQRYRRERKIFRKESAEKILMMVGLYQKGIEVFGSSQKFVNWLDANNISLGSKKPKDFLKTSQGIELINDELLRIEYGVLA